MLFDPPLKPFLDKRPVAVLTRATLEHAFASEALDELFRNTAADQYQHTILFSRLVELLGAVVTRRYPSVHAAYRADPARLGASLSSVYDKLNHTESALAEALLGHTAAKLRAVMEYWPTRAQPVAGLARGWRFGHDQGRRRVEVPGDPVGQGGGHGESSVESDNEHMNI